MTRKQRLLAFSVMAVVIACLLGGYAFSHVNGTLSELTAFASAILAATAAMIQIINSRHDKDPQKIGHIYVSTPFNLDPEVFSMIKNSLRRFPVFYVDDFLRPGDKFQSIIDSNLKHVNFCFMIVSGELTPMQKYEIKVLKRVGAKIIPVINGEATKIPASLEEYRAISLETFLNMTKNPERHSVVVKKEKHSDADMDKKEEERAVVEDD